VRSAPAPQEDRFGDFADFTSASRFLPGGGGQGMGHGPPSTSSVTSASTSASAPPPSASARAAAALGASAAASLLAAGLPTLSLHRPAYPVMGLPPPRSGGGAAAGGAAGAARQLSDQGSLLGEFSDPGQPSPAPSVAPSRTGDSPAAARSMKRSGGRTTPSSRGSWAPPPAAQQLEWGFPLLVGLQGL
jgi:hypothetical protein